MSDNKVDNKLDFRNVKHSQFDGSQINKMTFSELQSSTRTYNTNPILKDAYTHFIQTTDNENRPTKVEYYQATDTAKDKLQFRADSNGDLAGTYFTLQEFQSQLTHVFYYVVNGVGNAPNIGDKETAINLNTNDSASIVCFSTKAKLDEVKEFEVKAKSLISSFIEIEYLQFGETSAIDTGTSGFLTTRIKEGSSYLVGDVEIAYNVDGYPIYNGNVLKGLLYNPYTASFDVERDEITVTAEVDLAPLISKEPTIYNINMPTGGQEYSITFPVDTKRFQLNIRDHLSKYTISYVSGGDFITKKRGVVYSEQGLELTNTTNTVYFKGFKDNLVMEIVTWK